MIRRARYWLWRFHIWRTAHLMPDWHRFYREQISKARRAHKPTRALQSELTRRVHSALRKEVSR